jgi:molybdate transport system ATP-binding protein
VDCRILIAAKRSESVTLTLERVVFPLAHFTLEVSFATSGAATALYGPSGAGKTTILELIAGLRRPTSGRIVLDGQPLDDVPARQRRVGYVTQDDTLFPHLSVRHNLLYGARRDSGEGEGLERVAAVLEIAHLLDRDTHRLSGGEKKRVALARALLSGPKILLLDEPLAGVDVELRNRVLEYLVRVREEFPIPLVYVTHEIEEATTLCDQVVRIDRGRVV